MCKSQKKIPTPKLKTLSVIKDRMICVYETHIESVKTARPFFSPFGRKADSSRGPQLGLWADSGPECFLAHGPRARSVAHRPSFHLFFGNSVLLVQAEVSQSQLRLRADSRSRSAMLGDIVQSVLHALYHAAAICSAKHCSTGLATSSFPQFGRQHPGMACNHG